MDTYMIKDRLITFKFKLIYQNLKEFNENYLIYLRRFYKKFCVILEE